MEFLYPEIALNQPKADPRTVLLHKRNFLESSSDHMQDFQKNSKNHLKTLSSSTSSKQTTTTANCDKSKNISKISKALQTDASFKSALARNTEESLGSSEIVLAVSTNSSAVSASFQTPSSSSTSSLFNNLVKFSKSCHFNASFNNFNLHKTQKTKLIFFLLFIWCAILIQTTQALPVRRTTTSGRKLILHTNVYRERYHQKLLEEQRQHKQQQQQIQELQLKRQQLQLQQQQLLKQALQHPKPVQEQQPQQQQVQKNHIFSPGQNLRKHPQPQAHYRHHLHQRAAPSAAHKMTSDCNGNKVYSHLHGQINASMMYFKKLCKNYLRDRGNENFEDMSETWKLHSLKTRNPNRKPIAIENELHKEIYEFYLNLNNFLQLIDYAIQDTNDNKTIIEHGEELQSIDTIIEFFNIVKTQINFSSKETEDVLGELAIEKPNLSEDIVEFNTELIRRARDFLIIKNIIEEFERISNLVQNYCENNQN